MLLDMYMKKVHVLLKQKLNEMEVGKIIYWDCIQCKWHSIIQSIFLAFLPKVMTFIFRWIIQYSFIDWFSNDGLDSVVCCLFSKVFNFCMNELLYKLLKYLTSHKIVLILAQILKNLVFLIYEKKFVHFLFLEMGEQKILFLRIHLMFYF